MVWRALHPECSSRGGRGRRAARRLRAATRAQVNEEGTVAAAATAVVMTRSLPPPPITVRARSPVRPAYGENCLCVWEKKGGG